MCGLAGIRHFNDTPPEQGVLAAMMTALESRGPDAQGMIQHNDTALGHRRLSIIDLSTHGQQPMHDPELGLSIVFNGCLYNYRELRQKLISAGYQFFSTSDTEVILKAWHHWQHDCVRHFNGMFAFAIHERDSGRLALARDRLGIKPLYLAEAPGAIAFASTLPALLAWPDVDTHIDPVALNYFMSFHGVVPAPHTILSGMRKLPPATLRVYEPDGTFTDEVYWTLPAGPCEADAHLSEHDWQALVEETFKQAVLRRCVADVPVGVLLSGGVDSSLITALLAETGHAPLHTFSIGFEGAGGEAGDEFRYSDLIAQTFGTTHHRIRVGQQALLDALPGTFAAMSEPMVSYDNVGFYLLAKAVSEEMKVVQSGQGADEVFGGYHWYPPLMDSTDAVGDYCRVFLDRDFTEYARTVQPAYTDTDYSTDYVRKHFAGLETPAAVDKALHIDTTVMLVDDPVKRVDNMTMAWGVEARVPFLDHELVELGARIPSELKVRDGGKWILKSVARRHLPNEVIDRPKGYFPVPALKYLEGPYLDFVADIMQSRKARERGVFNPHAIDTLLQAPRQHLTPLRGSKLWQVAALELWLQAHGI